MIDLIASLWTDSERGGREGNGRKEGKGGALPFLGEEWKGEERGRSLFTGNLIDKMDIDEM